MGRDLGSWQHLPAEPEERPPGTQTACAPPPATQGRLAVPFPDSRRGGADCARGAGLSPASRGPRQRPRKHSFLSLCELGLRLAPGIQLEKSRPAQPAASWFPSLPRVCTGTCHIAVDERCQGHPRARGPAASGRPTQTSARSVSHVGRTSLHTCHREAVTNVA